MTPITITQDENNSDIELDIFLGKISIQDKHDQESITIALDKWQEVKETVDSMIDSLNKEPTDRFAMGTPDVARAGENKEGEPSTGQNWTHNQKGYDVKITSINRTGSVAVEEVATGQRDGFSRDAFLDAFTPKSKEGDL